MFGSPGAGYDQAITVFSPDGRLFQVEYAMEAVKHGTLAMAAKGKDCVVFCAARQNYPMQEDIGPEKIHKLDKFIGAASAGLTADARILIDEARINAQVYLLSYNETIPVGICVREISDLYQEYTLNAGVRPFGASLLIGGLDPDGTPLLYQIDPSASYWAYYASAIGENSEQARSILEQEYKKGLDKDKLINLLLKVFDKVNDESKTLEPSQFEIAYINREEGFVYLSGEEKVNLMNNVK